MIASAVGMEVVGWTLLAVGMTLSFLYSGLETGTYAVNKIRIDLRAEGGSRSAGMLRTILHRPREMLGVMLIGNNLANYLASAGMVLLVQRRHWLHVDLYSAMIMTPVLFIFCELLPKAYFHRHGETLTYALAPFLNGSRWVFRATGLVGLVQVLVAGVLRSAGRRAVSEAGPLSGGRVTGIIAEGRASGALTHAQSLMAERVVNIDRVRLRDVMVPLHRAVLVEEGASAEQLRRLLGDHGHPRIGVYRGARHNVVAVVRVYDVLLDPSGAPPAAHFTDPLTLPEDMGVTEALLVLQRRREGIGFVVSPRSRCVGVLTAKDLVEEIVGELQEW